jgi:hypothetical protein
VGDGGFTGGTAALLADAKERRLIRCVATERLTSGDSCTTSPERWRGPQIAGAGRPGGHQVLVAHLGQL